MNLKPKRIGNILLREIEDEDYYAYYLIGRDEEVTRYLTWGPFLNPEEARWVITKIFNERPQDGIPKGYAITMDGVMIGEIDFHTKNESDNSIEIGYILHRDFWGQGIMRKCASYMTSLAFSLGYDKVYLGSVVDNLRSIRLIESLGYHYEYERMMEMDTDSYRLVRYYVKYKNEEWLG